MGSATLMAQVVVEELLSRGVTEVVLSPGSRSAPLAYALFDADRLGRLRLHVRIDERSAGFLALGLAKASGQPVGVLTTSGTAAANLYPAVLEAWHSHLPLVVLTADRPRSLLHSGANQTTDQDQLFGRHVCAEGLLEDSVGEPRTWRFQVARVLTAASGIRSGRPGPVHLNLSWSEPLTPTDEQVPTPPRSTSVAPRVPRWGVAELPAGPRTVVVAGDGDPQMGATAAQLAAAARVPLLAEPSSNARHGPSAIATYRLLLGSVLGSEVERVVLFGHPTLSRPVNELLQSEDVELIVVTPYADWIDPSGTASRVVDAVQLPPGDAEWLARWHAADQRIRRDLDEVLTASGNSGPRLAALVWAGLGSHDTLVLGSSNPIRDCDLTPISANPPVVYANRGLAGIDGTVSTAVGIALATGQPTHALLGDLTLLHDANGLIIGPDEPRPDLRFIVANDDGGSIFATLEHGESAHRAAFERLFGTPHRVDLTSLAASTGSSSRRLNSVEAISHVLSEPPLGIEIVDVEVDRSQRRSLNAAISALRP